MAEQAWNELRSVMDFVRWGASELERGEVFYGHGTANALDEAAALVLGALRLPPDLDVVYWSGTLTAAEKAGVADYLRQRVELRRPLPYILGEAWFANLRFSVDERVLIPRSPIAELIADQFAPWIEPDRVDTLLDLCTGSGCIGIAAAVHMPWVEVHLTDLSYDALDVARANIDRFEVADQVQVFQGDLFDAVPEFARYDVIVSNPPYVGDDEMVALPAEYGHEPALALRADEQGLEIVARMLRDARRYLNDGGILIVEVGNSDAALEARFSELPFTWVEFQHGGHGVFVIGREALVDYFGD